MNWNTWAEQKVAELVAEIKFYITEGMSKETAIKIVKQQTTISAARWQEVLNQI